MTLVVSDHRCLSAGSCVLDYVHSSSRRGRNRNCKIRDKIVAASHSIRSGQERTKITRILRGHVLRIAQIRCLKRCKLTSGDITIGNGEIEGRAGVLLLKPIGKPVEIGDTAAGHEV